MHAPHRPWVWPERITTVRQVEELFQSTWCHTYALTDSQQIAEHWKHLAELYELTLHTFPGSAAGPGRPSQAATQAGQLFG
jgi:hypothetical protein